MKTLLFIVLFSPILSQAHPGIGIVKDSKGNIFYTDLQRVWKLSNGKKTIAVPDVHTHELYIDHKDNLFGEGGYYNPSNEKFYHYLWVYRSNGRIDTVMGMKEAYVLQDFSLARDKKGNEYYTKYYLIGKERDSGHVYKKTPGGREEIFATGNFKGVKWLHPQDDGSILYEQSNNMYRIDTSGKVHLVKKELNRSEASVASPKGYATVWGIWQDRKSNIYFALFDARTVRKIEPNGKMVDVYKSAGNWTPLHGVFDNKDQLWVMEGSDKNEVRVISVDANIPASKQSENTLWRIMISAAFIIICLFVLKTADQRRLKYKISKN